MSDIVSPVHPIGPIIHPPRDQPRRSFRPTTSVARSGCDFRSSLNQLLFVEYSGKLSRMNMSPSPNYAVLGTGYTTPEDVKASADGAHAYVTERTGDLVKVDLSSADRTSATVIATGMTAPQQLFLDEANNAAYTVEYATNWPFVADRPSDSHQDCGALRPLQRRRCGPQRRPANGVHQRADDRQRRWSCQRVPAQQRPA